MENTFCPMFRVLIATYFESKSIVFFKIHIKRVILLITEVINELIKGVIKGN